MSYFNILSQTMSSMFVRGIAEVAELLVSIRRIQDFMLNEEFVDSSRSNNNISALVNVDAAVSMKDVSASWKSSSSDVTLNKVTVKIDKGNLLGIIGPVGSGKSSLLQTILGTNLLNDVIFTLR